MEKKTSRVEKIGDEYYLVVPVKTHTAMQYGEIKIVRAEAKRARIIAEGVGFNPKTQQRMIRDGSHYYTFRAKDTQTDNYTR